MLAKYNKHVIELYDSIEVLPIDRFQMYNMKVLIDSGIGGDLNGFNDRVKTVYQLIDKDKEAAKRELTNMQQNVILTLSKQNPKLESFVILIKSINGRKIETEDLTNDGIKAIIKELGKMALPYTIVKNMLDRIKKNLILSYRRISQTQPKVQKCWSIMQD